MKFLASLRRRLVERWQRLRTVEIIEPASASVPVTEATSQPANSNSEEATLPRPHGDVTRQMRRISTRELPVKYQEVVTELEDTVARAEAIVQVAISGFMTFSAEDLTIETINPTGLQIYGYEAHELIGQPLTVLFRNELGEYSSLSTGELLELVRQGAMQVANKGEMLQTTAIRKNGEKFPVEYRIAEVRTPIDHYFIVTFRDITARVQAEAKQKEREIYFRRLIENAMDLIIIVDKDAVFSYLSPSVKSILGYEAEELIGQSFMNYLHPDDIYPAVLRMIGTVSEAEGSSKIEYRMRRKDNSWCWLQATSSNLLDDPVINGIVSNSRDITLQRKAEEKLRENETNLTALIENTQDLIYLFDRDKRLVIMNSTYQAVFETVYGVTPYIGMTILDHVFDEVRPIWTERYDRALNGEMVKVEGSYNPSSGHFDLEITLMPIFDRNGQVIAVSARAHDITEMKQNQRELQAAKEAAESANRAKSSFLTNMSHELRTPLNAIIGYSEMLEEEFIDLQHHGLIPDLRKIQAAGNHLLDLINNVLDLSKIEAGRMELFLEYFDVEDILKPVLTTVEPLVAVNQNTLSVNINSPGVMYADSLKLRQTLVNLLSNAAKFTENGEVSLTVFRTQYTDGVWLIFEIADTGVGMTEEQIQYVFNEFQQADSSTTRRFGGTGLGLTISRRLCQMMGGDIEVKSQEGIGTTFTVKLPMIVRNPSIPEEIPPIHVPPDISTAVQVMEAAQRNGIVLVVDDNPQVREMIMRMLTREGFAVETAINGIDGLEKARLLHPDAITLDVMMHQMDGWSMLSQLKSDPVLASIPVIMVTILDDRSRGFALGAADYLTKPIDRARLIEVLGRYRRPVEDLPLSIPSHTVESLVERFSQSDTTQSIASHYHGHILLVEDDEGSRELLSRILTPENWWVDEATNGLTALAAIQTHKPDVILLDLMMPEMDGFELIGMIHRNPDWREIPIIILTALELTEADKARLNGNVIEVIMKNATQSEELLKTLRALIERYVRKRLYGHQDEV
jgi:PAS domain S-box-containing protein